MGLHSEAQLDRRYIEMVRLLNLYLNHFPRSEKYGLALMIRRTVYDVYALIIEAQKRYQKKTTLTNLDIRHEQFRMLVRKHALSTFRRAARRGRLDAVVSSLGHARRTASRRHMIHHIKEHHHALYPQLPESVRRHHHLPARPA